MATNDIGRVTPIWRGFYSAATTYELNDIVIDTAGSVWWHKSEEQTTGVTPAVGDFWDAVIDMSIFSGLIQTAIVTAQTAVQAAQAAETGVAEDVQRAETAAGNAETYAQNAQTSAANVGAYAQAAEAAKNAAAGSAESAGSSATAAAGSKSDAEAYAVGKRGGTDVGVDDPTYHNNAKYYADQAGSSAEAAAGSKSDAEAYAVGKRGGEDVGSEDPAYHNNAKYWSEQAEATAEDIEDSSAQIAQNAADVADLKTQLFLPAMTKNNFEHGKNLFNKDDPTIINGAYLISNGAVQSHATYKVSEYIPIKPETKYTIKASDSSNTYGVWYGSNGNVISTFTMSSPITVTAPENASLLRVSINLSLDIIMIVEGETLGAYEPYLTKELLKNNVDKVTNDLAGLEDSVFKSFVYAENIPIPLTWEYGSIDLSGNNVNNDREYYARTISAITTKEPVDIVIKMIEPSSVIANVIVVEYNATTHALVNRTVYQTGTYPIITLTTSVNIEYRFCIIGVSTLEINLNAMNNYATFSVKTALKTVMEANDQLESRVDGIISDIGADGDIVEQIDYTATAGYIAKSGTAVPGGTTYAYTNKIPVKSGDVIRTVPKGNGKDPTIRFLAAFSGETAISDSGAENVISYTVPNGIDYVVVTGYQATAGNPDSIPYIYKFTKGFVEKITDSNGFVVKKSTFTDGEQIDIPLNNVSKNVVLTFDALITAFDALEFGRAGYANAIRVTNENVIILDANGNAVSTTAHGLTIANTISVRIEHSMIPNNDEITVIVSSNGVIANAVTKGWTLPRNGKPYVKSDGSSLTDCACGFAMKDMNKATWVFGDSYCSITNNRWMGQLKNAGYADNILLNAYPGESAAQNTPSFMNIINKGNPKVIVWANGMNDGSDGESRPNGFWLNAINVFITACESRGIIPILCTIPTVPGDDPPTTKINNEQKNAWIRASGKRYIDFAKAVGADEDGNWYAGMLYSDGIHPTETGAIALFNRAVADCPELIEQ